MGRRKIEIAHIENERHRQVTFVKRKAGLIKKATELSILCNAEVALIVFAPNQKMTLYSSSPIEQVVKRFTEYSAHPEVHTNEDYFKERARRSESGQRDDDSEDGDGADDGKDSAPPASSSAAPCSAACVNGASYACAMPQVHHMQCIAPHHAATASAVAIAQPHYDAHMAAGAHILPPVPVAACSADSCGRGMMPHVPQAHIAQPMPTQAMRTATPAIPGAHSSYAVVQPQPILPGQLLQMQMQHAKPPHQPHSMGSVQTTILDATAASPLGSAPPTYDAPGTASGAATPLDSERQTGFVEPGRKANKNHKNLSIMAPLRGPFPAGDVGAGMAMMSDAHQGTPTAVQPYATLSQPPSLTNNCDPAYFHPGMPSMGAMSNGANPRSGMMMPSQSCSHMRSVQHMSPVGPMPQHHSGSQLHSPVVMEPNMMYMREHPSVSNQRCHSMPMASHGCQDNQMMACQPLVRR